MRTEDRPGHHRQAEPSIEDDPELSFSGALRDLVDDLFTCQPIAEALQGVERDEAIEAFVNDWKQGLTQHLQEMMEIVVETFLIDLKRFQLGQTTTFSPAPGQGPNIRDVDGQPT
jgi:hypothetical protein